MFEQFQQLADDNTSGATELIHRLLALCENCTIGNSIEDMKEGLELLDKAQISMPSLHTVIHILRSELLPVFTDESGTEAALSYILSLQRILEESGATISGIFANKLEGASRILTMSRSSTVISALKLCHSQHKISHLYVMESRPMNEGWRTIRDCSKMGIKSTLLVDAAMVDAIRKTDCIVVGADSISSDGYLLNKTGTTPLAMCASELDVPVYVLCDSLKFSPQTREHVVVESRPPNEVVSREETDDFTVWNRYFEWVPIQYITEFITERGAFPPDQLSKISAEPEAVPENE